MLNLCTFAVRLKRGADRALIEGRAAALERFYAPLRPARVSLRWHERIRLLAGVVRFDGHEWDGSDAFWFGRDYAGLDVCSASAAELRAVAGPSSAIAVAGERAALLCAPGPVALFAAESGGAQAWSSHAVAAAWLAAGEVRLEAASAAMLVGAEMVGGERSLVAGVRAVPAATVVRIDSESVVERSYWPDAERWAPVAEQDAYGLAADELVNAFAAYSGDEGGTSLALTAGLDSRVAALALREAGVAFSSFTWGPPDWEDPRGAAEVARALGVGHESLEPRWLPDDRAVSIAVDEARWNEGARVEFARPPLPDGIARLVTGAGGETGRAFYYGQAALGIPGASSAQVADHLAAWLTARLAGAEPDALNLMRGAIGDWVAQAQAVGIEGWRCLDHVYSEQRFRRWARQLLIRSPAELVPAFGSPGVQRAFAYLPLETRVGDGFHRRFVAERMPALAPPDSPLPARPSSLRRAAGRAARAVRGPRTPAAPASMWEWEERPLMREWAADEVLRSPLLSAALGDGWLAATRQRFLAGERAAQEAVQWAAGPVALQSALRDLNSS